MDMPTSTLTGLSLKELFDAGLHFGHQTKRWNPKMKSYIFDKRNGIHIIDLTQTVGLLALTDSPNATLCATSFLAASSPLAKIRDKGAS